MGRMYSISFENVSVSAAQDFFEILAGTNKPFFVHGWQIGQTSDVADAAEEGLRIITTRATGSVTSGSGGSTPTPAPLQKSDTASGATVEANNTTRLVVGTGAITVLETHVWNVRVAYQMVYTPETRPYVVGGDRWVLALPAAPADALSVNGTVWIEEMG